MTGAGSPAAPHEGAGQDRREHESAPLPRRLDLPDASTELLAIIAYLTAVDGPLGASSGLLLWHERLLLKAQERLEAIDGYLRGRVAFLVAGRDHGYDFFAVDLEIAAAALDTCRATTLVVKTLLAGRLPSDREVALMGETALRIYAVLESS